MVDTINFQTQNKINYVVYCGIINTITSKHHVMCKVTQGSDGVQSLGLT